MEYRDGYHIGCALGIIQRRGEYNVELGCKRNGGLYREGCNIDNECYKESQVVFYGEEFF